MPVKPEKPSPDFPLFAHACGKWAKKIKAKLKYFGRWDNPQGALEEYQQFAAQVTDTVSVDGGQLTVRDACNMFLTFKEQSLLANELSQHSFDDYRRTCTWMADFFVRTTPVESLAPTRFSEYKAELAKRRSVLSLGNEITRVKTVFKWCWDQRLIAVPLHFGQEFRKASLKTLRIHRRSQGKKMFSREEIHDILEELPLHMQAMAMLGINCGYGPSDYASLKLSEINLDTGWADHPRLKTGVERHCPLWPETIAALRASLARRREPLPEFDQLFFIRRKGKSWESTDRIITKQFRQAMLRAGINKGGSYWLRHTFATIAGGSKDQVGVNFLMGHIDGSMAGVYREEIADERLTAITNHVRHWLFGPS